MSRKFPRNPLEIAFQELEELEKQIDAITGNHEKTAPFRQNDKLPPGIEGQIVISDYIPLVFIEGP